MIRALRGRVRRVIRRFGLGTRVDAALVIAHLLLAVAVCLANPWLFLGGWALATIADWHSTNWDVPSTMSRMMRLLRDHYCGFEGRTAIREALLIGLLAHTRNSGALVVLGAFVLLRLARIPSGRLVADTLKVRNLPILSRNIDVSALRIVDTPRVYARVAATKVYLVSSLLVAAGATPALGENVRWPLWAGCGLGLLVAAVWYGWLRQEWRRHRSMASGEQALALVQRWVREHQPRTVLHFSGMEGSAYQVNMWLDTLAELDGGVLLLLRDPHMMNDLGTTRLPVFCIPSSVGVMGLDLSCVKVFLYAGNVGYNISTLRLSTAKHVFIGHGDSDKSASVNPFSKVYDQIWTAGRAGADRYATARVGVPAEDLVEVGRPQLGGIATGARRGQVTTVLYAPTWEGWEDQTGSNSLLSAGENIIRQLLAAPGELRVLYRPHPFTGKRDPKQSEADERIRKMLAKANAARPGPRDSGADLAKAEAELRRVRTELAELLRWDRRPGADPLEQSRDGLLDAAKAARIAELRTLENTLFWASVPPWEHRVLTPGGTSLYSCFNESDALVSDISSVVSDFVASGKPYAIADVASLGAEEFRRRNTAARAALILGADGSGIAELLAVLRGDAPDTLAEDRRQLKDYLLGPDEPSSMERFKAAASQLAQEMDLVRELRQREASPEGAAV